MISIRRFRQLPPHILQAIHQHLNPLPVQRVPVALLYYGQRAPFSSLLSKVGLTSREEKFKRALDQIVQQAQDPQTWPSFPSRYNSLLNQYRNLKDRNGTLVFLGPALSQLMLNFTRIRTPNRVINKYVADIFEDIKEGQWKTPLTPDHYLPLIRSRAQNEDFQSAETYLQDCLDKFPLSSISTRVFIVLLGEYRRYNDYESVWRVYKKLKKNRDRLDRRIYDMVQDVVMGSPAPFLQDHILEFQQDFEEANLGPIAKLHLLLVTFMSLGQREEANEAAKKLRAALESTVAIRFTEYRGWEALFKHSLVNDTLEATRELMEQAIAHGYKPYSSLLHRVIIDQKITSIERLRQCEEALSVKADTIAWSIVIHKILAAHGIDAALAAYEESKRSGILPAAYMLHPLMRALCGGHLRYDLQWTGIETSLRLYGDLAKAADDFRESTPQDDQDDVDYPSASAVSPSPPLNGALMEQDVPSPDSQRVSPPRVWPGPDSMIYDTLLRAIAQFARTNDATRPIPQGRAQEQDPRSLIYDKDGNRNTSGSTPNGTTLWSLALTLLDDMRRLNIPSSPMSITALIILTMRVAPTFRDAFRVYRSVATGERLLEDGTWTEGLEDVVAWGSGDSNFSNRFELDGVSYENLIRGFCTLKPKREGGVLIYPPADLYLEMVKDMQMAGYGITEDVYMTFLHRLGRQARSLRLWEKESYPYSAENEEVEGGKDLEELDPSLVDPATFLSTRHSILHGIRTMHNHIVLNAGITPSVDLLNAMLDAYNKVAAVHDAFKVWDTIFLSRIYNTESVSIILDTCGWAKVGHKALQIWNQLVMRDFVFNKNNWDSRVECLCRIGRLDDALKVVCLEMPTQHRLNIARRAKERIGIEPLTNQDGEIATKIQLELQEKELDITPDAKTLGVLFSFATRTNQVEEVRMRVRRYLPAVWQSIPSKQKNLWVSEPSVSDEDKDA